MTFADAKRIARSYDMTLTRRAWGEFRLNYKGGTETTAYYSSDLEDIAGTARAMWKQGRPPSPDTLVTTALAKREA